MSAWCRWAKRRILVFGLVEWQVDGQKLGVSSASEAVDCGRMVSQVLDLVPLTPVRAIGHNFHFTASRAEWEDRPRPTLGDRGLENLEGAEQVRWSGIFRYGDARLEVTVAYEADLVAVLLNYHRNMDLERAAAAPKAEDQIAQAREAAGRFREDFEHSPAPCWVIFFGWR